MLADKLRGATAGEKLYVDDVFSTYLYTGNGSTQTINNGIDLAGKGGLVWTKNRKTAGYNYVVFDSSRKTGNSFNQYLFTNTTAATNGGEQLDVTNTGYSVSSTWGSLNTTNDSFVSWTFRKAPKFFDVVTYTGNGGSQSIAHSLGITPGMILIKQINASGRNWVVHHRSLGTSQTLYLNTADSQQPDAGAVTGISATTFTLGNDANTNLAGTTYVAYLFAHDPSADGMIQCGSYTGNGSSQIINCGFSTGARFILIKRTDSTGDWYVWDSARGIVAANDPRLSPNTTAAEVTTNDSIDPDSSGFIVNQNAATNINVSSGSYIYLAIA